MVSNPSSDFNILLTVTNDQGEQSALVTRGKSIQTKSKYFLEAPKERVLVKQSKSVRAFKAAGKIFGYLIAVALISVAALSYLGEIKARVVLSGSMEPAIKTGDLIFTVPPSKKVPKEGDVVAYVGRRFDGGPVGVFSHRIIGGDAQSGFIVKGDANPSPDVQRPKTSDITGVVVFVIPFIGRILSPRVLLVLAPIAIGLWLVIDALRDE